jgi:hypothetical protein
MSADDDDIRAAREKMSSEEAADLACAAGENDFHAVRYRGDHLKSAYDSQL